MSRLRLEPAVLAQVEATEGSAPREAGSLMAVFNGARNSEQVCNAARPYPLPYALAGAAVIIAVMVWLRPQPSAIYSIAGRSRTIRAAGPIDYEKLQPVLARRCYICHGEQVQMKNIRLDSPSLVKQHAQALHQQVVVSKTMPMNNASGMTEAERALVGQWFAEGASVP